MTQQPTDVSKHYPGSSYKVVTPEHYAILDKQFQKLVILKEKVSFEYRTLTPYPSKLGEGIIDTYWHHCIAFPDLDEDGSILAIFGILTDISHMKAAEALHVQKQEVAEEGTLKICKLSRTTLICRSERDAEKVYGYDLAS